MQSWIFLKLSSYNEINLAQDFLTEVQDSFDIIKNNPYLFQRRFREIRIIYTRRFPYSIYYTVEEDTIFVHAVLHMKRDPK